MEVIMDNENKQATESAEMDYIQAIEELKANSVPKSDYEQLRADNKKLLDTLVNRQPVQEQPKKEPTLKEKNERIQQLRNDLYGNGAVNDNLTYWEKTCELRDLVLETTGNDPFVSRGSKIVASQDEIAGMQRVREQIGECIKIADGDSQIFTNELQRRMQDTMPVRR